METSEHDMDLTKVFVVRSAKGVDMLCVDDYLYHFDRIGKNNTYRWLCNRRKDKRTPCKSRLSTILPNTIDSSKHIVVDVAMPHTHPRCSDHEITKVSQRKRLSTMQNEIFIPKQPKRARLYERATAAMQAPEWITTGLDEDLTFEQNKSIYLDFEDKDRVYMLRRRDGRVMVCIDGHLYYLGGKSNKGDIYRWTCVRQRDIACTAKVCTEATLAGAHRLRPLESDVHIHPHYSAAKLLHMFTKHQIVLVDDEQTAEVLEECPYLEYFDPDMEGEEDQLRPDDLESIIIEDCEENGDLYMKNDIVLSDQSLDDVFPNAAEVIENYVPAPDYNALTETDLTKFTFLPSAKGKKVLCLNRYLYHFDSQSRSNGHMFFTCILRRDAHYNCHCRVTLSIGKNGPLVMRINGEHTHKPDLQEILRRINQQKKLEKSKPRKAQERLDIEAENYDGNEDEELNEGASDAETEPDTLDAVATDSVDSAYEQLEDHLQSAKVGNVLMKKVIGIDGIKMEPETFSKASMIVQYMKDGADNISAKIEILPSGLASSDQAKQARPPQPLMTNKRRRRIGTQQSTEPTQQADMDLTKICTLRSAKGSEMLCVDGFIYYAKNRGLISRNYWVCIKSRDPGVNCKSRISTATQKDGTIRVLRVYNSHSHEYSEDDIKRRLFNEVNIKANKKLKMRPLHFLGKTLEEIKQEYGDLAINRLNVSNLSDDIVRYKKPRVSAGSHNSSGSNGDPAATSTKPGRTHTLVQSLEVLSAHEDQEEEEDVEEDEVVPSDHQYVAMEASELQMPDADAIIEVVEEVADMEAYGSIDPIYTMKLYAVSDGPPSLAVRMTLKALNIQYQLVNVDFCALEHRSVEYDKMNPQKEIPVLDDDGFYLSESIAIMQYLCDKYAPSSTLYPREANQRALVNQRLCFNMGFYYAPISAHSMAPIFFDYERTPMSLKRVENALETFEKYLQRTGTKYAAAKHVTIADFALVSATLCLEAIDFDLSPYALVQKWYATFKAEYPELWEIANSGMQEINAFEHNPPDLSLVEHPFHPTRKTKA